MNTKINITIGLAVLAVVFGVAYLKQTKVEVTVQVPKQELSTLGAIPGNTVQDFFCINGGCDAVRDGAYANATTTLFSSLNPFGATSTASVVLFTSSGATSSMNYYVGTTTLSSIGTVAAAGKALISTGQVGSSTAATIISGRDTNLGSGQVASGGVVEIMVGPAERITGYVDNPNGDDDEGGVIGNDNIFSGRFRIDFRR